MTQSLRLEARRQAMPTAIRPPFLTITHARGQGAHGRGMQIDKVLVVVVYNWLLLLLLGSARDGDAILVRLECRHLHCITIVDVDVPEAAAGAAATEADMTGRIRRGAAAAQLNVIVVVDFRQLRIFAVREEVGHKVVHQHVPLVDELAEKVLRREKG